MKLMFFISLGLLLYVYIGYPLVLLLLAALRRTPPESGTAFTPPVSLIIPAYNEAGCIVAKLHNALELDYPGAIEIILALDGCTDSTLELAREVKSAPGREIVIYQYPRRSGKMAIMNRVIPLTKHDFVVLTDANVTFKLDAVRQLMRHFSHPQVGCVGGVKRISATAGTVGRCEGLYWHFESFVKQLESRWHSTFVDGAIYALRKELYGFPPETRLIMDDFAVSLGISAQGRRVVFEPAALAYELASEQVWDEFRRKVRVMEGALTSLRVSRTQGMNFQLFSHKILRWSGGIWMLLLAGSNVLLPGGGYQACLVLQGAFYACALAGWLGAARNIRLPGIFNLPFYFCLTNLAQLAGGLKYVFNPGSPAWEKIDRG